EAGRGAPRTAPVPYLDILYLDGRCIDTAAARPGSATRADRARLGGDDRRRGCRRARGEGVRDHALPDPVVLDGADAEVRHARLRLHGALRGPRARVPDLPRSLEPEPR